MMNAWLLCLMSLPLVSCDPAAAVELASARILPPSRFTAQDSSAACALRPEAFRQDRRLDYETAAGRGTLTGVPVRPPGRRHPAGRSRRQIYGPDVRFSIGRRFLGDLPFAAAVRLSTGCTGVLVTERHVLTAAHCLHDGRDYVRGARRLRVGFLRPGARLRWVGVRSTRLPRAWAGAPEELSMDYDYALLELRRPQARPSMGLAASPPLRDLAGGRVHFSGFDSDRDGELVYRSCRVQEQSAHLLYQHCDARPGASGSGVYGRVRHGGRWKRRVIGVFSGHQWVEVSGEPREYNVAVRLTPPKYDQICYWIRKANASCDHE